MKNNLTVDSLSTSSSSTSTSSSSSFMLDDKYYEYDKYFKINEKFTTESANEIHYFSENETKLLEYEDVDIFNNSVTRMYENVTVMSNSRVLSALDLKSAEVKVNISLDLAWPVKHSSVIEGDVVIGGLMMVHSRDDLRSCGPIMPQGGIQALEAMLYTLDMINKDQLLPNITVGAHILDDCDKDSYGLEMAVDFIKGN